MRRIDVLVVAVLLLALTGCTGAPPSPAPGTDAIPGVALTRAQTMSVVVDYDNRNNAAIASTVKAPVDAAWGLADTGPLLAADQFATAVAWNGGTRFTPLRLTLDPKATWANSFTSYPVWAIVRAIATYEPASPTGDTNLLLVVRRDSGSSPWLAEMVLGLTGTPTVPDDGAGLTTAADETAGVTTLDQVAALLEHGTRPDFSVTPPLSQVPSLVVRVENVGSSVVTCQPYRGAAAARDSVRVVRSTSGVLTVVSLSCRQTITARPGRMLTRPPGVAVALGVPDAPAATLIQSYAVTFAVSRSRTGGAVAIGADYVPVRGASS